MSSCNDQCGLLVPRQQVIARQLLQKLIEVGAVMFQSLRLSKVKLDLTLGFPDCLYPFKGSLEPISKQGKGGLLFRGEGLQYTQWRRSSELQQRR